MEFTTREHRTTDGGYSVEVIAPEPLGYGAASVWKGTAASREMDGVVWKPALVKYASTAGMPLTELALQMSAIMYAASIAAELDQRHPAGSPAL